MNLNPTEYFRWTIAADELIERLLNSPNRHTQRLYRADLESFRCWLAKTHPAESLPLMLAILFGGGRDGAVALVAAYCRAMLVAGKSVATVNRHMVTLRAVVRIAREMGRIDWDLVGVANVRADNVHAPSVEETHATV